MDNKTPSSDWIRITGAELANYVVCPEAWRLQRELRLPVEVSERQKEARQKRAEWEEQRGVMLQLRRYAKVAYVSLFLLAIIVFLLEHQRLSQSGTPLSTSGSQSASSRNSGVAAVPDELALLMVVLGTIIFLWDLFERRGASLRKDLGLKAKSEPVNISGSSERSEETDLVSEGQKLSSRPNALLREDGFLIPVDIHPTTDKVRDRHVVPLLLHLAILEEREGKASPYGVLIMGKDQRRTQIKFTPEKQRWLWSLIEEMRSIANGVPAVPSPAPFKCRNCRVKKQCKHSMDGSDKSEAEKERPEP